MPPIRLYYILKVEIITAQLPFRTFNKFNNWVRKTFAQKENKNNNYVLKA